MIHVPPGIGATIYGHLPRDLSADVIAACEAAKKRLESLSSLVRSDSVIDQLTAALEHTHETGR